MSAKRLHVHSLPLIWLGIMVTVVATVPLVVPKDVGILGALLQPVIDIKSDKNGFAQISMYRAPQPAIPGIVNELTTDNPALIDMSRTGDQLLLQSSLSQPVKALPPSKF